MIEEVIEEQIKSLSKKLKKQYNRAMMQSLFALIKLKQEAESKKQRAEGQYSELLSRLSNLETIVGIGLQEQL